MPASLHTSAPFAVLVATLVASGIARAEFGLRSVPPRNSDPASVLRPQDASCSPALLAQADPRDRQPPVLTLTESAEGVLVTTPTVAVLATATDERAITLRVQDNAFPGIAGAFTTEIRLQRRRLKGLS